MISIAEFKTTRFWGQIGTSCFQKNQPHVACHCPAKIRTQSWPCKCPSAQDAKKSQGMVEYAASRYLNVCQRMASRKLSCPTRSWSSKCWCGILAETSQRTGNLLAPLSRYLHTPLCEPKKTAVNYHECPTRDSALHAKCSTPATYGALMMCQVDA